jgi:hypothetical protein
LFGGEKELFYRFPAYVRLALWQEKNKNGNVRIVKVCLRFCIPVDIEVHNFWILIRVIQCNSIRVY